MKICSKCGLPKEISEFYKRPAAKDGHRNDCIPCHQEAHSVWAADNKDKIKLLGQRWRNNNPEKSNAIYARYRSTEKRRKSSREWARRNRKVGMERFVERYASDIQFNLAIKFRRRVYMAVRNEYTVKAHKTIDLLGTTYPELKKYIEQKFTEGMSWDKLLAGEIHLDHILPCASFDLTDAQQQSCCFHYTNLQPLWAFDNISKGAKVSSPFQPSLAMAI